VSHKKYPTLYTNKLNYNDIIKVDNLTNDNDVPIFLTIQEEHNTHNYHDKNLKITKI